MNVYIKVLLPGWIFDQAEDKQELRRLIMAYMNKNYPDYTIEKVKGKLAICRR